jgi:hypothetical protein
MRHCRLRIMRMTSKPLIAAEAVGMVLNPRVGLISRLSAPGSVSLKTYDFLEQKSPSKSLDFYMTLPAPFMAE